MNKRILSSVLALAMVVSMGVTAFATDIANGTSGTTTVIYEGTTDNNYTVTIPATMSPGDEGTVSVEGTWAADKWVVVTTDNSVILRSDIDSSATKELDVAFDGLYQIGNNGAVSTNEESISIDDMYGVALGNWTGEIVFDIRLAESTTLTTEVGLENEFAAGTQSIVEYSTFEGITWGQWLKVKNKQFTIYQGVECADDIVIVDDYGMLGDFKLYYKDTGELVSIYDIASDCVILLK